MQGHKTQTKSLVPLATLLKQTRTMLRACSSQLALLEWAKDQPHILNKGILQFALKSFSDAKRLFPVFILHCNKWQELASTKTQLEQIKEIEENISQLQNINEQVLFLMDNLKDYASEKGFSLDEIRDFVDRLVQQNAEGPDEDTPMVDPENLMQEVAELGNKIRSAEEIPITEAEKQSERAMSGVQQVIQILAMEGINPHILSGCLFGQWLQLITLVNNQPADFLMRQAENTSFLVDRMIIKLNEIEDHLQDEGPTPLLKELGEKINLLRKFYREMGAKELSDAERKEQTAKTSDKFIHLMQDLLNEKINLKLLESIFLYFWVRTSTLLSEAPEEYFQKLERHWPKVFKEISSYVYSLMKI